MLSVQFPIPQTNHIIMRKKSLSISIHCRNNANNFAGLVPGINPDHSDHSLLIPRLAKCCASEEENQIQLPQGLEAEAIPRHVAVIMDGNRRWAKSRGLPVQLGHVAGRQAMKQLVRHCKKFGVEIITVFAFSTENWARPQEGISFLMNLFEEVLRSDIKELMQNDARISFMGDVTRLPPSLQNLLHSAEERGKDKKGLHLVIALNYSGGYDITEANRKIARKVKDGVLQVEDINETLLEQHLETSRIGIPAGPDLLIRTSGELRLSNFMLWQLAYTELFFIDKMFPDFDEADLVEALTAFLQRQRRFGGHKYY